MFYIVINEVNSDDWANAGTTTTTTATTNFTTTAATTDGASSPNAAIDNPSHLWGHTTKSTTELERHGEQMDADPRPIPVAVVALNVRQVDTPPVGGLVIVLESLDVSSNVLVPKIIDRDNGSIWDDDITVRIYVMSYVPNIRTILDCLVEIERILPLGLFEVLEEASTNPRGGPEWGGLV
ncbi:hypothetical protein H257_08935 [Aphanomyces astaci]|uniref:Uncharacterized protein n=1 Tax=Aphanomyces astaci TaxID=112090 RepID=W4GD71_APHAT|nr:hypothetical protein H257_08935 [Aphanomyces astaci]ETV77019.1 hypothetical protein H257_08935 [Aphanomyces astaci]|eukprot:XP_009833325.1 hypothetical protein H257_08935 [Aphanomyces astaci]